MASGFSKRGVIIALLLWMCSSLGIAQEYQVVATPLKHEVKDLSQRSSKVLDQNGERCALLRFETPIPALFSFQLGAQHIEKRINKDDEVWIWVSADVRKMTIECENCQTLRDYRVSLKSGNVYRAKLSTGLPQETSTHQHLNIYCEQAPFNISIDGSEPILCPKRTYHVELPVGSHEVQVSAKLYKTTNKTVRLLRSGACNDTIRLENNYGEVQITSNVTGYTVYLDDEQQRNTRTIRAEPGTHRLTIRKDRYETYETTVSLRVGDEFKLPVKLVPAHAVFNISARDKETEIWVDGQLRGHNQISLAIDWGIHTIEGRREGYDTWEYDVHEFNASSERFIVIPKLVQQFGSVRLSVFPADATIRLDGATLSATNGVYTAPHVTTGKHYVHVIKEDYKSIVDVFTLNSGQLYVHDYQLEHIPMGVVSLSTDKDVAIYVKDEVLGDIAFLGKGYFHGKIQAGEQTLILQNLDKVSCEHVIYVNEGTEDQSFTLPFMRQLKIRTNAPFSKVSLEANRRVYPVKAHKKTKIEPQKYIVKVNSKGYEPFVDTLDLSHQSTKYTVYHAMLRKNGAASAPPAPPTDNSVIHRFYDNAGRWYVGIIDLGYMFDFGGMSHWMTAGILPFRYKMLGVNLLDLEFCVSDSSVVSTLAYRPKISLVVPAGKGFAFTFYGGATVNLSDAFGRKNSSTTTPILTPTPIRTHLIGGISMQINSSGIFPVNIFGEYRYPVNNKAADFVAYKQFRVGISFSLGIDR